MSYDPVKDFADLDDRDVSVLPHGQQDLPVRNLRELVDFAPASGAALYGRFRPGIARPG
jgi:hypothetical protein